MALFHPFSDLTRISIERPFPRIFPVYRNVLIFLCRGAFCSFHRK
nr:MAG TPA: hypothetical protein [Caudoviricetes sp.]